MRRFPPLQSLPSAADPRSGDARGLHCIRTWRGFETVPRRPRPHPGTGGREGDARARRRWPC